MKDYKVLIGCMLVPHKMTVFEIFEQSLFEQTYKKFDIVYAWGHRERSSDIRKEEILRTEDMTAKTQRLWDVFKQGKYDFLFVVATDTYYPPDTIEKAIAYFEENEKGGRHIGRIGARTYNRVRRCSFHEPQDTGEYTVDDWGGAFDCYTYHVRDLIYPRYEYHPEIQDDSINIYSAEYCGMMDTVKAGFIDVTPPEHVIPYAYHIYLAQDVMPDKKEKIIGGLPVQIKERFVTQYKEKIRIWEDAT